LHRGYARRVSAAWIIAVTNPAPPNNPAQPPATTPLTIHRPFAAVYHRRSERGPVTCPPRCGRALRAPTRERSKSPALRFPAREIISIFGQNMGPASISTATPDCHRA
jgi:hypothetical protein